MPGAGVCLALALVSTWPSSSSSSSDCPADMECVQFCVAVASAK